MEEVSFSTNNDNHRQSGERSIPNSRRNYRESRMFPIGSTPYGLSFGEWTAKWWQWALSLQKDINPLLDLTGRHCAEGQEGTVWFLAGTTGNVHSAKRKCTIPRGNAILFPIITSQFSFAEVPFIKTDEELISYTAKDILRWSRLEVDIDGLKLHDLHRYRVQYGPFELYLPNNNIWNIAPGPTRAASDGFWIFLQPLPDGDHRIYFHGIEPNFETEITYYISIKH